MKIKKHSRIFAVLFAMALMLSVFPLSAFADDETELTPFVAAGDFDITPATGWTYAGNTLTVTNNGTYTIGMAVPGSSVGVTDGRIVVAGGVTANITLDGVKIESASGITYCAFDMAGATVTLTLADGTENRLESTSGAGIHAPGGTTLTINGSGSLFVSAAFDCAGIGGNRGSGAAGETGGTITIGGNAKVTCMAIGRGAGIGGGGAYPGAGGGGGSITITDNAEVEVQGGGNGGAGLGGGAGTTQGGSGGTIAINSNATVRASSAFTSATPDSAAIGGGGSDSGSNGGDGGNITITGGSITVRGLQAGTGIGGAPGGGAGTILITGGTITASRVSSVGSDIGVGDGGTGGSITITGGSINCQSSTNKIVPAPTKDGTTPVYLSTLDFNPAQVNKKITACNIAGYGLTDVKTDISGNVYFWLPATGSGGVDTERVTLTVDGSGAYTNIFARTPDNTTAATLLPLPVLTAGAASRISDTAGTVKFTSSKAAQYYYAIVNEGAAAPAISVSGLGTACGTTEVTVSLTLTAGAKDVYIVAKDASENLSNTIKITVPAYLASPSAPVPIVSYPVVLHFGEWTGAGVAIAKVDGPHTKFVRLLYKGKVVDPANYKITEGSTIITMTEEHLKTYPLDTHSFVAEYTDGQSEPITLTVKASADSTTPAPATTPAPTSASTNSSVPKTGDGGNLTGWWIALLISALCALSALALRKWRLKRSS